MTITFTSCEGQPHLIAFTCAEGVKIGRVIKWLGKLWQVQLSTGMGCYVMPGQVLWLE